MNKPLIALLFLFAFSVHCMEEGAHQKIVANEGTITRATNSAQSASLIQSEGGKRKFLGITVPCYVLYTAKNGKKSRIMEDIFVGSLPHERLSPIISPDGTVLMAWRRKGCEASTDTLYTIDISSGKTLRSDSFAEHPEAQLTFAEDSSLVVIRKSSHYQARTVIEITEKDAWLTSGVASLKKVMDVDELIFGCLSYRPLHCFDSGLIALYKPSSKKFLCLSKNGFETYALEKVFARDETSRIIWGTDRTIAAITTVSSNKIVFFDFSSKPTLNDGIETPQNPGVDLIGSFSAKGLFFACSCLAWENQILLINCEKADKPFPVTVLKTLAQDGMISCLEWSKENVLHVQINGNADSQYIVKELESKSTKSPASDDQTTHESLESKTTNPSASDDQTTQEANESWFEDLLSNLHAQ